jgi:regulator of chromosome condensation (RCC1) repeat-containing protein
MNGYSPAHVQPAPVPLEIGLTQAEQCDAVAPYFVSISARGFPGSEGESMQTHTEFFDCARFLRFSRRLAPVLAPALLAAALGCREDNQSPTGPESELTRTTGAVATALVFRQVSTEGGNHTCGVTTDDRAYCWGFNGSGQLGDGTTTNRQLPTAVLGELRFHQVNAGQDHTCGITPENRAYCWGLNGSGQLGDGTTANRLTPVLAPLPSSTWRSAGVPAADLATGRMQIARPRFECSAASGGAS